MVDENQDKRRIENVFPPGTTELLLHLTEKYVQ